MLPTVVHFEEIDFFFHVLTSSQAKLECQATF